MNRATEQLSKVHPLSPARVFVELFADREELNRIFSLGYSLVESLLQYCEKHGVSYYDCAIPMIREITDHEWFEGEGGLRMLVMYSQTWRNEGDPPFFLITIFDKDNKPLAFESGSTHQKVGKKPWQQGKPYPYNPIEAMKEHMAELSELKKITNRVLPWEKKK